MQVSFDLPASWFYNAYSERDHEQLELFPKRGFRCDCQTTLVPVKCTLATPPVPLNLKESPNTDNEYGQNFYERFCRCGRDYNPETETETMVQCVACEVSLSMTGLTFELMLLNLRTGFTSPV